MLPLWDLGVPSTRVPINGSTLALYILPMAICYLIAAMLAVTHHSRTTQVAVWLVICLLAWRAMAAMDMSPGEPTHKLVNVSIVSYIFFTVIRPLDWALHREPLVRYLRPEKSTPSAIMDTLDLAINFRGYGWNLSRGIYFPQQTRPTHNRIAFAFHTFLSLITYTFLFGVFHRAVLSFPGIVSTSGRPTIIDETLPFSVRYFRAAVITTLTSVAGYATIQQSYDAYTLPAVLFFGQDPAQWPPAFDAPWRATSLHDFWGRRWHQWRRRELVLFGGYPLGIFFGRMGAVVGTLLASGILHDLLLLSISPKLEAGWMLVGFGMMGPGMMVERAFYLATGKRVGGVPGWVWTMSWLLLWGGVLAEGCARAGGLGEASMIDDVVPPVRVVVERWVIDFDAWLRTI